MHDNLAREYIATGIITAVISIIHTASFCIKRNRQKEKRTEVEEQEEGLNLKQSFGFLFPPRSSIMELIVNIFVAAGFSFIVIYQSLYLANNHHVLFWLNAVQVLLSSYSLISHAIPESTPYSSDDSFNLFSHHY